MLVKDKLGSLFQRIEQRVYMSITVTSELSGCEFSHHGPTSRGIPYLNLTGPDMEGNKKPVGNLK